MTDSSTLSSLNVSHGTWESIPVHILLKIFSKLGNYTRTASTCCVAWRTSAYLHTNLWEQLNIDVTIVPWQYFDSAWPILLCKNLTLHFDSLDIADIRKLHRILTIIKSNKSLQCLTLLPKSSQFLWNNNEEYFYDIFEKDIITVRDLCTAIINIASNVTTLKHFSWGLTDGFNGWQNFLLTWLSQHQCQHLQSLHLTTLYNNQHWWPFASNPPLAFVDQSLLYSFRLTDLSIDYVHLSDSLLIHIAKVSGTVFQRLHLFIQHWYEEMPFIQNLTWSQVVRYCPNLGVTLNLVQSPVGACHLDNWLLQPNLPLVALRLYCCSLDGIRCSVAQLMSHVATYYSDSLRTLHIVDACKNISLSLNPTTGEELHPGAPSYDNFTTSYDPDEHFDIAFEGIFPCQKWSPQCGRLPRFYKEWYDLNPDPFVMLVWSCTLLEDFVLTGYWINAQDLKAFAALRGSGLKQLTVPTCCILFDSQVEVDDSIQLEKEVTKLLNKDWHLLRNDQLPSTFFDETSGNIEQLYLPYLWKEQCPI